ncbi:hypothetical protein [Mycolicibacterium thermoresistibile]
MTPPPTAAERQAAVWVAGLFLLAVVLQRFAVPGLPTIALLIPATFAWVATAWARGIVVIDIARLIGWLTMAALTGCLVLVQFRAVEPALISVQGWALMLVIWLLFVIRLRERSTVAYLAALRHISSIATGLAIASAAMIGVQVAGVPIEDWFAQIVPPALQLDGFNYTYPLEHGSPIYKSNAFIGLEPSMVSAQLGVGVLAAVLSRAPLWQLVVMITGMLATVAGSGMIIVLIAVVVMTVIRGSRRVMAGPLVVLALLGLVGSFTTFGQLVLKRVSEFQSDQSSTSLRVFEPYRVLIPRWMTDAPGALFGYGPGSSNRIALDVSHPDIMVPTPMKILFEYGLIGGLVVTGFILLCFWGGPSRAFAVSLFLSTWLLQSGLASLIITLPALVTVTMWSPRTGPPLEVLLNTVRSGTARPPDATTGSQHRVPTLTGM